MGDRPVYTCRCHVFRIDSTTKKSWIPAADGPVQVSFFFDPSKKAYRVVSVDSGKPIINSTIVAGMTFSRTAQKFGQWSDQRANTVYGVGFNNEDELTKFADQFEEAKVCVSRDAMSPVGSPPPIENNDIRNIRVMSPPLSQADSVPSEKRNSIASDKSFDVIGIDQSSVSRTSEQANLNDVTDVDSLANSSKRNSQDLSGVESMIGNLKMDNERLRSALGQSQGNVRKWESELQTLRTNNARLQSALQENSRNVEEWKNQLIQYRDENLKYRKRCEELEIEVETAQRNGAAHSPRTQKKISKGSLKTEEVERVKQILEKVTAELVEEKSENSRLQTQLRHHESQNGDSKNTYENGMICQIQADMEIKLRELGDMNRKLLNYARKT